MTIYGKKHYGNSATMRQLEYLKSFENVKFIGRFSKSQWFKYFTTTQISEAIAAAKNGEDVIIDNS